MRPAELPVWCWRHPRATALATLAAGGLAEPAAWLVAAPAALWWASTRWPDAIGRRHGDIRAAVLPPGRACPACSGTHARTVLVGLDADGQPRCIEPDHTDPAQAHDQQAAA